MRHSSVRSSGRSGRLPLAILGSIGLLFLGLLLFVGGQRALFVLRATRTTGEFVDAVAHTGGSHGGTFLYPRFQFTASSGRTVKFTSHSGSTNNPPYAEGQKVPVLYDPNDPANAMLDAFWSLWGPSCFVSVFVIMFLGLPYWIWRQM